MKGQGYRQEYVLDTTGGLDTMQGETRLMGQGRIASLGYRDSLGYEHIDGISPFMNSGTFSRRFSTQLWLRYTKFPR